MPDLNEQLPAYMRDSAPAPAPPAQQPMQQPLPGQQSAQQQPPAQQSGLDSEGFAPITDAQTAALLKPQQSAPGQQLAPGQQSTPAQQGQEALPEYMQAAGGQSGGKHWLTKEEEEKIMPDYFGKALSTIAPYVTPLGEGTLALDAVPVIGKWLLKTGVLQDAVKGAEGWLDSRGILQTAVRGAGQGAGIGGVTSITDAEDGQGFHPVSNIEGGAIGGAVLGGALGGVSKGIDKLAERFGSEEVRAAEGLGEQHGVPVYTTDIAPPTGALGKTAQGVLEQTPLFNTGGMRRGQQEAREHLAAEVKARFTDSGYTPDALVNNVLHKDIATRYKANKKYGEVVRAISDRPISSSNTIGKIDQKIKELTTSPGGAPLQNVDSATVNRLKAISNDIKADPSFANLQRIRTNFRENVRGQDMFWPNSHKRMSDAIYGAMGQDLKGGVKYHLGEAGLNKWGVANQELYNESKKVKQTVLKRVFNNGEATPEVADRLLKSGDESAQKHLFDGLSPKGRGVALSGLIQNAVDKSTDKTGYLNPTGLANALTDKKIASGINVFGTADSKQYIDGVVKILNLTREAQAAAAAPKTGARVIPILAAMNPIVGIKFAAAGLFGKLYESPKTRKIIMKLANKNLKPGHVNKLLNGLGEESGLHAEMRNASRTGSPASETAWSQDAAGMENPSGVPFNPQASAATNQGFQPQSMAGQAVQTGAQMSTPEYMRQGAGQGAQTVQGMNPWQQEAAGMTPPPQPPTAASPQAPAEITRGMRNNNPLNIKSSTHNMWRGKAGDVDGFVQFTSPEMGVRAAVKTLKSYRKKGLTTLTGIINRFAPGSENNTAAYIHSIEQMTGISRNKPLTNKDFPELIKAMGRIESGANLSVEEIQKMWKKTN